MSGTVVVRSKRLASGSSAIPTRRLRTSLMLSPRAQTSFGCGSNGSPVTVCSSNGWRGTSWPEGTPDFARSGEIGGGAGWNTGVTATVTIEPPLHPSAFTTSAYGCARR